MLKYCKTAKKGWRNLQNLLNKLKRFISIHRKKAPLDFIHENSSQLLKRLHVVSIILTILYIYYFFADFVMLNHLENRQFRYNLIVIHLLSLFISIVYICIYRLVKNNQAFIISKKANVLIYIYISMYLLLGVASSLNSQNLSGNIDAYITIVIGVAVLFQVQPVSLIAILLFSHILFYIGLHYTVQDLPSLVTKQINSTATVIVALIIGIIFYTNKKRDYFHQENFAKLFEINPYPLILSKIEDGELLKINHRAFKFYGINEKDVKHIRAEEFYKNQQQRQAIIEELKKTGYIKNQIIEQKTANGNYRWVQLNYELIDYKGDECILAGVTDITDLKEMEAELVHHASIDPLTGIQNRRSGIQLLKMLLTESERAKDSFVLCFIDVNNLKIVNDRFGHAEGDRLIKTVCRVIEESLEDADLFFRYGGDEFIVVFNGAELDDVKKRWNMIVKHLRESSPALYEISVSHGLFQYEPKSALTLEDMIKQADEDMYKEKRLLKS